MTKSEFEKEVQKHMRILGLTREQAEQLTCEDEGIDRMTMKELTSDLSAEQKKTVKEMTKTGTKKATTYKFDTKTRKKDEEKEEFVAKLAEMLRNWVENVEIVNPNKEISFNLGENEYSLNLVKHRKAKK